MECPFGARGILAKLQTQPVRLGFTMKRRWRSEPPNSHHLNCTQKTAEPRASGPFRLWLLHPHSASERSRLPDQAPVDT